MFNQLPYMIPNETGSIGAGTSLLGKINWGNLLSNTQKTLSVVNQAIPLYHQVKPVVQNLKTFSKIGKELVDNNNIPNIVVNKQEKTIGNNGIPTPSFFI